MRAVRVLGILYVAGKSPREISNRFDRRGGNFFMGCIESAMCPCAVGKRAPGLMGEREIYSIGCTHMYSYGSGCFTRV